MTCARARLVALMIAASASMIAACGAAPAPTAGDMTSVLSELAAHGATVRDIVAGDPGCADASLQGNGSHIKLMLAADGRDYDVYLFRWRRATDYDAAGGAFSSCVSAFADRLDSSVRVDIVEVSPWRAFGPGWTKDLHDTMQQSLAAAAIGE
jgi:hypothetical protein